MIKKNLLLLFLYFGLSYADAETEFVTQVLEPLGGKIQKPKDWFYRERHGGPSYIWILSKEDVDLGPYVTGVKIQFIGGIKEGTGESPEQFMRDFMAQKKSQVQVLSECKAQAQDFFIRACIQTIEPAPVLGDDINFRIQYSIYWNNDMDMALLMIQGTREDLWNEHLATFNTMQDFEMIDMSRFE